MQFYEYSGFINDEKWSEENEDRRVLNARIRKISRESKNFNKQFYGDAFFFVADACGDTVLIGIICKEPIDVQAKAEEYVKALKLDVRDTSLEETTFNSVCSMLGIASRCDFIDDDDAILEDFNLDKLNNRRSIIFGEDLFNEWGREYIYRSIREFSVCSLLIPELDRIYEGGPGSFVMGHSVHYMIQSDDNSIQKVMYHLLLPALYSNKRLRSRRYCFLDLKPGENFSRASFNCLYKSCISGSVIIRYNAGDDSENDYANGSRDTIEAICETIKKYRHEVLTIICLPRECSGTKTVFYENLGTVSFVELKEDFVSGEKARAFLRMLAKDYNVKPDRKLYAMLSDDESYLAPDLDNIFDEWYDNKLKTGIYPQYKEMAAAKKEALQARSRGTAYEELSEMIGLTEAKKVIDQALNYFKAQRLFKDKGMKEDLPSMHMVFTGNPGTAKTTVARLFARIMKENDLLSIGKCVEVGRGDLVGKYVGWTAPTIQKKFKEAQGSVLFIDEAYSLVDDRDGSYGDEAISTIVQEMENHREDVIVIFAGYPDKMEAFLNKNPGLRSRIAFHVPFSDYNTEELCDIARLVAKKKGLTLTDDAAEKLSGIFGNARKNSDFGNGRYVRNAIEKARMAQATRLLSMDYDSVGKKEISTILAEDIDIPAEVEKPEKTIGFQM